MINKVKSYFKNLMMSKKQKAELKKMQQYYTALRLGANFIQAVRKDLANQKNQMNRHQRRRFEKSLVSGEFTPEMIEYYKNNIDRILKDIEIKLEKLNVKGK